MAAKKEVTFKIEIISGESIGPFRLGKNSTELDEAIRALGADVPITLDDLGVVAWSRGDDGG